MSDITGNINLACIENGLLKGFYEGKWTYNCPIAYSIGVSSRDVSFSESKEDDYRIKVPISYKNGSEYLRIENKENAEVRFVEHDFYITGTDVNKKIGDAFHKKYPSTERPKLIGVFEDTKTSCGTEDYENQQFIFVPNHYLFKQDADGRWILSDDGVPRDRNCHLEIHNGVNDVTSGLDFTLKAQTMPKLDLSNPTITNIVYEIQGKTGYFTEIPYDTSEQLLLISPVVKVSQEYIWQDGYHQPLQDNEEMKISSVSVYEKGGNNIGDATENSGKWEVSIPSVNFNRTLVVSVHVGKDLSGKDLADASEIVQIGENITYVYHYWKTEYTKAYAINGDRKAKTRVYYKRDKYKNDVLQEEGQSDFTGNYKEFTSSVFSVNLSTSETSYTDKDKTFVYLDGNHTMDITYYQKAASKSDYWSVDTLYVKKDGKKITNIGWAGGEVDVDSSCSGTRYWYDALTDWDDSSTYETSSLSGSPAITCNYGTVNDDGTITIGKNPAGDSARTVTITSKKGSDSLSYDITQAAQSVKSYSYSAKINLSSSNSTSVPQNGSTNGIALDISSVKGARQSVYDDDTKIPSTISDSNYTTITGWSSYTSVSCSDSNVTVSGSGSSYSLVFSENTASSEKTFTVIVSYNDGTYSATENVTYTQAGKVVVVYGKPVIKSVTVEDIPASGGFVNVCKIKYTQTVDGVAGSETTDYVSFTKVEGEDLGTDPTSRTKIKTVKCTYTKNGQTSDEFNVDVYQEANVKGEGTVVANSTYYTLSINTTSPAYTDTSVQVTMMKYWSETGKWTSGSNWSSDEHLDYTNSVTDWNVSCATGDWVTDKGNGKFTFGVQGLGTSARTCTISSKSITTTPTSVSFTQAGYAKIQGNGMCTITSASYSTTGTLYNKKHIVSFTVKATPNSGYNYTTAKLTNVKVLTNSSKRWDEDSVTNLGYNFYSSNTMSSTSPYVITSQDGEVEFKLSISNYSSINTYIYIELSYTDDSGASKTTDYTI